VLVPREPRIEGRIPLPLPFESIIVIPVTPVSSIADTTRFNLFAGMMASIRFMITRSIIDKKSFC
jgi:hypothetical protein